MAPFCAAVATNAAAAACPVSRQATHVNAMAIELRQARATSVLRTKCSSSRLACEETRDENITGKASIVPLGRSYFLHDSRHFVPGYYRAVPPGQNHPPHRSASHHLSAIGL